MSTLTTASVLGSVAQRLRAAASVLLDDVPSAGGEAADDVHVLLEALVADLQSRVDLGRVWLVLTALSARFPLTTEVRAAQRRIELAAPRDAEIWLLRWAQACTSWEDAASEIEIVTDKPLVDVDFSARHRLSTGIQRVVRNLTPRWSTSRDVEIVRWKGMSYTRLTEEEAVRAGCDTAFSADAGSVRLIPWGVPVLLPEVPFPGHGARLSALAEFSPNHVALVGYDCIPVISAELVRDVEREKFGEYLELVKYADVVAGISESAAAEFRGFVSALAPQGLTGPRVVSCGLPTTVPVDPEGEKVPRPELPEVLCVGSLDTRKNQIALVEATEHLWRQGVRFRLNLLGAGGAQPGDLLRLIEQLKDAGRPLEVGKGVTDARLDRAYRRARVVVFPTLHEGFGLPVVEALSYGVPVITSDFGSTKEIGEGAGALLVDPEDVWALAAAIKDVLEDDELHARLVSEARSRPPRTWDDYADELWRVLVP